MPSNRLILCRPLLLQPSIPASGSFPMSRLFISGGQRIGASASASVLPMNIQGWFPLELTGLISLQSRGLSRVFSNTTVQKHQFFSAQSSSGSNSHIHTRRRKFGHTQREVREVRTEVEIRGRQLQAKDGWQHQRLGEARKDPLLGPQRGGKALWHLEFELCPSQLWENPLLMVEAPWFGARGLHTT